VKFVFLIWALDGDLGKGLEDEDRWELFFPGKLFSPGSYYDRRLKTLLVPVHLPRTKGGFCLSLLVPVGLERPIGTKALSLLVVSISTSQHRHDPHIL
jgi:hypothetical protein